MLESISMPPTKEASSDTEAQKLGALVGADAVLTGTVALIGEDMRIDARLITVEDGRILHAENAYASMDLERIGVATDTLMLKMVTALHPELAASAPEPAAASGPGKELPAVRPAEPPATQEQGGMDLADFSQWEILDGSWSPRGDVFISRGGHLFHDLPFRDYTFSVLVTFLEGDFGAAGVLMRGSLVPGERFRNGSMDIQGYGFNFTPRKTFNFFEGIDGKWYLLNTAWKEWPSDGAFGRSNRIVLSCRDTSLSLAVNGKTLYTTQDYSHEQGGLVLWVQEPTQVVSFSELALSLP